MNLFEGNLDVGTLKNWLWKLACKIKGLIDALKYKDYILPLVFFKRPLDVFDDEIVDFNMVTTGQGIISDDKLKAFIDVLG